MNTLIPNLSDALLVHSQAHESQSVELHDVALKMLALSGQTHICTDSLDAEVEDSVWNEMPGAVLVEAESAGLYVGQGQAVVATDSNDVQAALAGKLQGVRVVNEGYYQHKARTPAYQTWLVRWEKAEETKPECPFTLGDYVPVGHPRRNGAYKFPSVAQRVSDNYQMLQVHKDGDKVSVFDKSGKQPRGMAKVIDTFVAIDNPVTGIFEVLLDEGVVKWWDVLMFDGADCTKMPWTDRTALLRNSDAGMMDVGANTEYCAVPRQDELSGLERGKYLVRYEFETVEDLAHPFWFCHEAGKAKPYTVLPWTKPSGVLEGDAAEYIAVPDTGLPVMQIHRSKRTDIADDLQVKVFIADGARNQAKKLPQVVEMAKGLERDAIIEAVWTCKKDGVALSEQDVRQAEDLSDCEVTVTAFDLAYYDREDLTGKPMCERVETLTEIVDGLDVKGLEMNTGFAEGRCWHFAGDSARPLNGDCSHCFSNSG